MTEAIQRPAALERGVAEASAPFAAARMAIREVHRALGELRRGAPVILSGRSPLVLIAAETASEDGLAEFSALSGAPALVLLANSRATAVLRRPIASGSGVTALRLRRGMVAADALRSLADPTFEPQSTDAISGPVDAPPEAEAAIALAKLARLLPALLAAPFVPSARLDLFAPGNALSVSPAGVLAYPDEMAASLTLVAEAAVPLEGSADTRIVAFRSADAGVEHLAILIGRPEQRLDTQSPNAPLTRIHSECFTGDLLGSLRCDCGPQLRGAIARMAEEGSGILLYLAQEGRGIGIASKLRAYALQDRGADTADANRALGWQADERSFLIAARMLQELGVDRVRLLTNNPDKITALEACGITVQRREAHAIPPNGVNDFYLATKAARFGHLLG